jgi:ABC-2 type transport system ATP-binding protein
MRQRSKLAQAIVHDPDIVLLDEPLTGCDPVARVRAGRDHSRSLGAIAGKAVIVSSHILHEIEAMTDGDRAALQRAGARRGQHLPHPRA